MTERHGHQDALNAREELRALRKEHVPVIGALYYNHATSELSDGPDLTSPARGALAAYWAQNVAPVIEDSDVFWVSGDMTRLINTADHDLQLQIERKGFKPEPLLPKNLLTDCGFAWFDREVVLQDLSREWSPRHVALQIKAVGWKPGALGNRPGLDITLFADITSDPDTATLREALQANGFAMPSVVPISTFHWAWGAAYDNAPERIAPEIARWLLAFWTICLEEVATKVPAMPPRHVRRRWQRENRQPPTITIITLRRPKHPRDHDEPLGEHRYSHRFLVRGHWRNQPYGKGKLERRLQYIHPYIKGDPHLPFVEKSRVFKVVR